MTKIRGNASKFIVSLDGDLESNSINDLIKTNYPLNVLGANIDTAGAPTATTCFNGDIAEVVIFNVLLSTIDKQKIEGYLAHKWGLTANLPSDHPYKNSAP